MEPLAELIAHPERLNKDTLYGLRELVAKYPYYQAARLLFLQNLFLLHDPTFGEELRKAALYVPDRRVLFKMVEACNYEIQPSPLHKEEQQSEENGDRTTSLIDNFLRTTPDAPSQASAPHRKLTAADATTDYAAFLLQLDDAEPATDAPTNAPTDRSSELIDDFIENKPERFKLQENPEYVPEEPSDQEEQDSASEDGYLTMTLAKIYIKQQRYEKALEIIRKVNLNNPKKNSYFADQIRFLQKLIINQNHSKA